MSRRERVALWVWAGATAVSADFLVGWGQGESVRATLLRDVCSVLVWAALFGVGLSVWALWAVWREVRAESTHYTD